MTPAPAPGFSKAFFADTVDQGGVSTLTFTIDNISSLIEATDLDFRDDFPTGMVVATPVSASTTCTGGTLTASPDSNFVTYTGGTVDAASDCTVSVNVRALVSSNLDNLSDPLDSSISGTTLNTAAATLNVTAAPAPGFMKAFSPDTIDQGDISTLTFTINNSGNLIEASDLNFSDPFPAGMVVADPPNGSNTCGGDITAVAEDTSFSFANGTVDAGGTCTVQIDVRATDYGPLLNTSGDLDSSLDFDASGAIATLTVTAAPAPGFASAFAPDTIDQGDISTLTFTIDNSANLIEAADLAFTDNLTTGLVIAPVPNIVDNCGGDVTGAAGDTTFMFENGTIAEGDTCTISVDVRGIVGGAIVNDTGDLSSSLMDDAAGPSATLTVNAATPLFSKEFQVDTIDQGIGTTLTFTIDNSGNLIEATDIAFIDNFPSGMIVASSAATNNCGGTFTANAGATSVELAGGTVAELASCTISVDVQVVEHGDLVNLTEDLTSSLETAAGATDAITVNPVPLDAVLSFFPASISQNSTSRMTISLRNSAVIDATGVSVTDNLVGFLIAAAPNATTNCTGGTLTAPASGSTVSYTGGGVGSSSSCQIEVDVVGPTVGDFLNATDGITSNLGDSSDTSATLSVTAPTAGEVTFEVTADDAGGGAYSFTSATVPLSEIVEVSSGSGTTGPLTVSAGSHMVDVTAPTGVEILDISCSDTDSVGSTPDDTIALAVDVGESLTCTVTAQSSTQKTVDTIHEFLTQRADLLLTTEPSKNRRLARFNRSPGTASKLAFAPGDLKSMLPFTAQVDKDSYSFSTSLVQVREAAASVRLAHGSTKSVEYVPNYRFDAWLEAHYKKFNTGGTTDGHFAVIYAGADYLVSDNLLVGAMFSLDDMSNSNSAANSSASGVGWMFGPYVTARLAPNLYFDARIAGGRSNNEVSPFNTYTDSFSTTRWLAKASLTGEFEKGNWTIRPNATLSYFTETQDSYVDSVGATIPSQTIELGQLQIGPMFNGRFEAEDGTVFAPYFGFDAIYNLGDVSGATPTSPKTPSTSGWRGRVQAGVDMTSPNGVQLGFGATYDGLFRSGFEAWGLMFSLNIPFHKANVQ